MKIIIKSGLAPFMIAACLILFGAGSAHAQTYYDNECLILTGETVLPTTGGIIHLDVYQFSVFKCNYCGTYSVSSSCSTHGYGTSTHITSLPSDLISATYNGIHVTSWINMDGMIIYIQMNAPVPISGQIEINFINFPGGAGTIYVPFTRQDAGPLNIGTVAYTSLLSVARWAQPAAFITTPASGGAGTYSYQWQHKVLATGVVSDIASATGEGYQPPVIETATAYRRRVTSGSEVQYTPWVDIFVQGDVNALTNYTIPSAVSYVVTCTPQRAVEGVAVLTATEQKQSSVVAYYDGLGRPVQTVMPLATPAGKDLVSRVEYDEHGRLVKEHLPYAAATATGSYKTDAATAGPAFYTSLYPGDGNYAFTQSIYEASPLDRVVVKYAPGVVYRNAARSQQIEYKINAVSEVLLLSVNSAGTLSASGYYPAGTLSVSKTTDEDLVERVTYTDKQGKTILDRSYIESGVTVDTYYAYDDFGRLGMVIQPEGSKLLTAATSWAATHENVDKYCFTYKYISMGRLAEKKVPGSGVVAMVYDNCDRVAMTQDANQRAAGKWLLSKYDALGRQIEQRLVTITKTRDQMQTLFKNNTLTEVNAASSVLLASYAYDSRPVGSPSFTAVSGVTASTDIHTDNKGLKVYEKVAVLDGSAIPASPAYIERSFFYDNKGRTIQVAEKNHLGGTSRTSLKYDFAGRVLSSHESHQSSATATADELFKTFTYDSHGRLTSESSRLNGGTEAKIVHTYNELGQIKTNTMGCGTTFATTTSYNIQGWVVKQSSNYFTSELNYYTAATGVTPSYTGNITQWKWGHASTTNQSYIFSYDKLSRLTSSVQTPINNFAEQGITYDVNGNFKSLQRTSSGVVVDNLNSFVYDGNKVTSLKNNAASYTYAYDANGNCTTDGLGALKLEYNFLNLTGVAKTAAGAAKATYRWTVDGAKRGVKGAAGTDGYEYLGSLIYQRTGAATLSLEGGSFGAGRIIKNGSGYEAQYFVADHLGSTRTIVSQASAGSAFQLLERNDYYSYGGRHANPNLATSTNRFKFSGKEAQTTGDLKYLDFGARFKFDILPVWGGPDPLAEINPSKSPFHYCSGNPINRVDPTGMFDDEWDLLIKHNGDVQELTKISDKGGSRTQYVNVTWETGKGDIWNLGTDVWNNWPNNKLAMADILSNGQAALGPWNQKWWGKASGRLEQPMIDPTDLLVGATAAKAFVGASKAIARVFWSGGDEIMNTAVNYAKANGMTTLEMTRAGQNLTKLTTGMPWEQAGPMWQRLSAAYAQGAKGSVHVFHNATNGIGMNSIWKTIEYPIIRGKNPVIFHNILNP